MKGFFLSLQSEFYKSRKTLGFWSAILLPLLLTFFVALGFFIKSAKLAHLPPQLLWIDFATPMLGIMGSLLLPMFVIFVAYSVNSIEHKADTWKTLFTLPISKWAIYSAKYLYALLLVLLCLMLFPTLTVGFGNLLGVLKPELKFSGFHMEKQLYEIYFKLFLGALAILSIQFLLSILWSDFLKPMGIGFVGTIVGVVLFSSKWEYAYMFPYAQPLLSMANNDKPKSRALEQVSFDFFTNATLVSLAIALVVFIMGYFIVQRKSIK
ncbi:ABC transporter permease subunit [Mucilaginibacter robiniae]|uniref:ABC transporter permease subunit n=1 Tax=Mucilaginibacter robiniae TaxID=2728022 RepID=A0A7L5DZG2_9SPHI|nr:ABC transporter permease [Mucilaginibacter robiniae]QJD96500.1 ABC transporter permease subunit [Mucilaginibacter robiniae]